MDAKYFNAKRDLIMQQLYPVHRPCELNSMQYRLKEPFLIELALRERANRVGIITVRQ